MALSIEQAREEILLRRKANVIQLAKAHQERLRFHVEVRPRYVQTQALTDFFSFVDGLIPHDKSLVFRSLFRFPVKTNEITGICFDKLSRVFDGRNPAFDYQFKTTEQRDDWEWYRQERLKEPTIWQTAGFEHFKTDINSILVVDMAVEPDAEDKYPQPYFYWLPIDSVIAYKADRDGLMEWLIFEQEGDKIAVIDDVSYRLFTKKDNNIGELLVESLHGLGYTPARFFWNEPMSLAEPDIKASPLTKELSALDWFLFFHVSKQHLDLYGAYPIFSGYEQNCDYSNEENGDYCDGGFLKNKAGAYRMTLSGALIPCPKCGNKRIAGVGSFVEIPVPEKDQPDLRNPVQMLSVDKSSLDYNVNEEERLKNVIINSVVGNAESVETKEAINEKQIQATFESQSTVLNRVKKGFESAQTFVDETICRLRYGKEFLSAKVNYGTDFYTSSVEELRANYKTAKESGASESELDALQTQIIETEYRNNPTQLQRMLILADIEPYRHLSRSEVLDLYSKGIIPATEMRIKLNFASYIKRFERENLNIIEFGSLKPYTQKINIINEELAKYANESQN